MNLSINPAVLWTLLWRLGSTADWSQRKLWRNLKQKNKTSSFEQSSWRIAQPFIVTWIQLLSHALLSPRQTQFEFWYKQQQEMFPKSHRWEDSWTHAATKSRSCVYWPVVIVETLIQVKINLICNLFSTSSHAQPVCVEFFFARDNFTHKLKLILRPCDDVASKYLAMQVEMFCSATSRIVMHSSSHPKYKHGYFETYPSPYGKMGKDWIVYWHAKLIQTNH